MRELDLHKNQLTGKPPFAHFTWFGRTSLPLALKTSSFALAGWMPTEFGKLLNMEDLYLDDNKLTGTLPFAHVDWFGSTSLPLAEKEHPLALAGSIPTEFGNLINLTNLSLWSNKLTGAPRLLITYPVLYTSLPLALKRGH